MYPDAEWLRLRQLLRCQIEWFLSGSIILDKLMCMPQNSDIYSRGRKTVLCLQCVHASLLPWVSNSHHQGCALFLQIDPLLVMRLWVEEKKERKLRKQQKSSSHQSRKRGTWEEKPLQGGKVYQKRRKQSVRIRRVAGTCLANKSADLSWLVWRCGECSRERLVCTTCLHNLKLKSIVHALCAHRMSMKLASKFFGRLG